MIGTGGQITIYNIVPLLTTLIAVKSAKQSFIIAISLGSHFGYEATIPELAVQSTPQNSTLLGLATGSFQAFKATIAMEALGKL